MVASAAEVQNYIRAQAARRGIDPTTALRVFKQESSFNPNAQNISDREESYGIAQLNAKGGLGAVALGKGINIRDPNTWQQQLDFALDTVAKDGWRQWYGARDVGIGRWDGIGGRPAGSGGPLQEAVAARGGGQGGAPRGGPLQDAVAARDGAGQASLAGGAGDDRLAGGSGGAVASGGTSPTVNIGLAPESKTKAADAIIAAGTKLGSNANNLWDVAGGLAQVWAGTSQQRKLEAGEASALQKAVAGLDPDYQMAAQLLGGREGAAQAILSQRQDRMAAANRAEQRADRQTELSYQHGRDEAQDARADATLDMQRQTLEQGRLPAGYRKTDGGMEPIPGGPADPATVAASGFRTLTPDEVKARGLPAGAYQVGPDGKLDEVGGKGQTINLGGGENKQVFDAMNDSASATRAAATGLNGLVEAKKALNGGIISGAGADTRLGLQKVGALLGVTDPTMIQNTETFRSAIAPQVAAMVKATVGSANISNSDREFAEKAAGGNITLDAGSINRLVDIMDRASRAAIEGHRTRLDKVYPAGGQFDRERALFEVGEPGPLQPDVAAPSGLIPGQDRGSDMPVQPATPAPTDQEPRQRWDRGKSATPPSAPSAPQTDAEYQALPSGALFIDPDDGKTYRKP